MLASKEGDGTIPKNLEFLQEQLRDDQFAAYKSFELIEQKALEIKLDQKSEVEFRSGNRLGLSLLGGDDNRLKLRLDLSGRDGKKALLGTIISSQVDTTVTPFAVGTAVMVACVLRTVSTIFCVDWSTTSWSYALRRIRIFCEFATIR